MEYNLLVPCVYVSNKNWTSIYIYLVKTGWKVVWQKISPCRKMRMLLYYKFCGLLCILGGNFCVQCCSRSCWSQVLTWLRPKCWRYHSSFTVSSRCYTVRALHLPLFANCSQEEYDQCWNIGYVAPCVRVYGFFVFHFIPEFILDSRSYYWNFIFGVIGQLIQIPGLGKVTNFRCLGDFAVRTCVWKVDCSLFNSLWHSDANSDVCDV